MSDLSQRLRSMAAHTGLDAVAELLVEAADHIDAVRQMQKLELNTYFGKIANNNPPPNYSRPPMPPGPQAVPTAMNIQKVRDAAALMRGQSMFDVTHVLALLDDALTQQPAPQPAGWKLVPVEPTPEMLKAAKDSTWIGGHYASMAYRAMLAAAPQQPAPQPLTEEMVLRAAKELCRIYAGECQVDEQDTWNIYADQFKRDAKAALAAAHGIKEQP